MSFTPEQLREILDGYTWIKVRQHHDPHGTSLQARFDALQSHHVAETEFLISVARLLAQQLLEKQDESPHR